MEQKITDVTLENEHEMPEGATAEIQEVLMGYLDKEFKPRKLRKAILATKTGQNGFDKVYIFTQGIKGICQIDGPGFAYVRFNFHLEELPPIVPTSNFWDTTTTIDQV